MNTEYLISEKLHTPEVSFYIDWLGRTARRGGSFAPRYTDQSYELLDKLFQLFRRFKSCSRESPLSIWLRSSRGTISDFEKNHSPYEEMLADGDVESFEEYMAYWNEMFPDEIEWFELNAFEDLDIGYRTVFLGQHQILEQYENRNTDSFSCDVSELLEWLIESVQNCISSLENGVYNDVVEKELPFKHRTGTVLRKHYWKEYPDEKRAYFGSFTNEDATAFIDCAIGNSEHLDRRIDSMTSGDFFRMCSLGYAANNYTGQELTPLEQYLKHGDGRDEGLRDIDPKSKEAFWAWYHDRNRFGGHPWEVCAGGNSTHINLQVMEDSRGLYMMIAGSSLLRSVEAIKFYLALQRADVPVVMWQADILKARLMGEEKIGIVPHGITPVYCSSLFQEDVIIDFMNLDDDASEEFTKRCNWMPLTPANLK